MQVFLLGIIKDLPDSDIGFELYKSEMWEKVKVVKYVKVFGTITKQYLNHAIILKVPIELHKISKLPKTFHIFTSFNRIPANFLNQNGSESILVCRACKFEINGQAHFHRGLGDKD